MDLTAGPDLSGLIDATELHRYAEALLTHLAADGTAPRPQPGVTDVPGYWLAPAIDALVRIMSGQEALEPLTRAARHDEGRTALFLCLALAVSGQGDRVHASWLQTAFGDLSSEHPVTSGQRAVWLAAARGAYGPAGKIFVLRKLDAAGLPAESEPERWLKALVPGEPAMIVPPSLVDYPELADVPELGGPAQAAARLARLRGRCTEITSPRKHTEPSPAQRASRSGPVWPDPEPLAVLRSLINPRAPKVPLSSLTGHLLDDVQPGSDSRLAALALHVAAPMVRSVAEGLSTITQSMPPTEVTVPILGHPVTLRPEGPDAASISEAEQRIAAENVPRRPGPWPAYALLTFALLALGLSFVTLTLVCVAGALVLGASGGYLLWHRHLQAQADAAYVTAQVRELRELADRAVWALHDYARETPKRAEAARRDLTELNRLLRRGPRAA